MTLEFKFQKKEETEKEKEDNEIRVQSDSEDCVEQESCNKDIVVVLIGQKTTKNSQNDVNTFISISYFLDGVKCGSNQRQIEICPWRGKVECKRGDVELG